MNRYVRKLFGIVFQSKQAQQIVRIQQQHLPTSPKEWEAYWNAQGQSWRYAPEIDMKRQEELTQRRAIVPNIEKGIYPFKGMKLSRADVEWLLATHENGRGPVLWNEEKDKPEHERRRGLDLRGADLRGEDLAGLPLAGACGGLTPEGLTPERWHGVTEEQRKAAAILLGKANLSGTQLQRADLWDAQLQGVVFSWAQLQEADLREAQLQRAVLKGVQLQGAYLWGVQLQGADLRWADLENAKLDGVTLSNEQYGAAYLVDISWGNVNLAVIDWEPVTRLGDELEAQRKRDSQGKAKGKATRLKEYKEAVRANRQLTIALENQGLSEDAARFAYRALVLQRYVYWKQRNFLKWLGSAMLDLLAGYGYRMWHIFVAYLFIVLFCAGAYFVLGMYYEPHLSFLDALLTSITAFHGRVFSEPFLHPDTPQLWVTAFEAVAGLIIEGVFIAMLTQKFFGK